MVTYVEQEPDLLPGTLRENLILGTGKSVDDEILIAMLGQFGLENFASTDGLGRLVGSGNSGLSAGSGNELPSSVLSCKNHRSFLWMSRHPLSIQCQQSCR